jgi:hypothetical protein
MEAVEGLIDMGIDVLQALQFSAVGMDPRELKRRFGDRLCFEGGVSMQTTLPFDRQPRRRAARGGGADRDAGRKRRIHLPGLCFGGSGQLHRHRRLGFAGFRVLPGPRTDLRFGRRHSRIADSDLWYPSEESLWTEP